MFPDTNYFLGEGGGEFSVSQLNGSYQIFSLGSELVSKRFSFYGINEVVFISICSPGKELSALIKTVDIHSILNLKQIHKFYVGILLQMRGKLGYNKFILICLRIIYCYPRSCRENSVNGGLQLSTSAPYSSLRLVADMAATIVHTFVLGNVACVH